MYPDEFLQTGRRQRNSKDTKDLKDKPRSRQRKETLKLPPTHPDFQDAFNTLLNGDIQVAAVHALGNAEENPFDDPTDSEASNDE